MNLLLLPVYGLSVAGCAARVDTAPLPTAPVVTEAVVAPATPAPARVEDLGAILAARVKDLDVHKVAIAGFLSVDGAESDLGRFLGEEVTTSLFDAGNLVVVERRMIERVLQEQGFQKRDISDPDAVRSIGKLVGADALVLGTYTDLGTSIRVNARIVTVETGAVASAVALSLERTPALLILLKSMTPEVMEPGVPPPAAWKTLYVEDFSRVEVGAAPAGWVGTEAYAVRVDERSRIFAPFRPGLAEFGIPLSAPITGDFRVDVHIRLAPTIPAEEFSFFRVALGDFWAGVSMDEPPSRSFAIDSRARPCLREACGELIALNDTGLAGRFRVERIGEVGHFWWNTQELVMGRFPVTQAADTLVLGMMDPRANPSHTSRIGIVKVEVATR